MSWLSGKEHQTQALVFLINRVWVQVPAVTLVSLSKIFNHCCVLRMGRKAVGPICCVKARKRTQCCYRKEKGFAPVFLTNAAERAVAPCKPF